MAEPSAEYVRPEARALKAVADLRAALADIRPDSPMYLPGHAPSAETACQHILELIEYGIHQIEVFVGPPAMWGAQNNRSVRPDG
jgi:hypothetical protein